MTDHPDSADATALSYAGAGVDIDAGNALVNAIGPGQDPVTWFWNQGQVVDEINWVRDAIAGTAWGVSVVEIDLAFLIEGEAAAALPVPGSKSTVPSK